MTMYCVFELSRLLVSIWLGISETGLGRDVDEPFKTHEIQRHMQRRNTYIQADFPTFLPGIVTLIVPHGDLQCESWEAANYCTSEAVCVFGNTPSPIGQQVRTSASSIMTSMGAITTAALSHAFLNCQNRQRPEAHGTWSWQWPHRVSKCRERHDSWPEVLFDVEYLVLVYSPDQRQGLFIRNMGVE